MIVRIAELIGDIFIDIITGRLKKLKCKYMWEPNTPIINTDDVKDISKYPKNPCWNIDKQGSYLSGEVCGEESFKQALQRFVLTKRNTYVIYSSDYGIEEAESIFEVKNDIEFKRQCNNIAHHLIEYFNEWIQEVYKISRKRNMLIVEMKVKGKPESLVCNIPNLKKKVASCNKKRSSNN